MKSQFSVKFQYFEAKKKKDSHRKKERKEGKEGKEQKNTSNEKLFYKSPWSMSVVSLEHISIDNCPSDIKGFCQ